MKWYEENELKPQLHHVQERGIKPSNSLPYDYLVNFENNKIVMTNLVEAAVPLMIYDKNQWKTGAHFYSYALYSKLKLEHSVSDEKYNVEVIGPNGFVRKFNGDKNGGIEVLLFNKSAESKIELVIKSLLGKSTSLKLENLYDKKKETINVHSGEQKIVVDVSKMKGWYDLKLKTAAQTWHFAGRIESGKPTVTDPHWA